MTNINFINNAQDIKLYNTSEGGLDEDYFGFVSSSINARNRAMPYLWFNRDKGIKKGKTYTFKTVANIGPMEIVIEISLTGTTSWSDFSIKVTAKDDLKQFTSTGEIVDVGYSWLSFYIGTMVGVSLYFGIMIQRFRNGASDDVTITLDSSASQTDNQNINLPIYDGYAPIKLLDVWGEGRLTCDGMITGFTESYNINKRDTPSSCNTDPIPNRLYVNDWDNPIFPIYNDGVVEFITVMGSPINLATAREMYRVLNKSKGVVILYGYDMSKEYDANFVMNFEREKGYLILKTGESLKVPFDQIIMSDRSYRIYGFPDVTDKIEL